MIKKVYWFNPLTGGEILLMDTGDLDRHLAHCTDEELLARAEESARELDLDDGQIYIDAPTTSAVWG